MKMYDHQTHIHFKVIPSKTNKGLDLFSSEDNKKWKLEKSGITLDQVMKVKQKIIDNNFNHLYKLITE